MSPLNTIVHYNCLHHNCSSKLMPLISFYSVFSEDRFFPYAIYPNQSLPSICSSYPISQLSMRSIPTPFTFSKKRRTIFFILYYNYIIYFSSLPPNLPICSYLLFFKLITPFHIVITCMCVCVCV